MCTNMDKQNINYFWTWNVYIYNQLISFIEKKNTTLYVSDQSLSWSKNNVQVDWMKNNDDMKQHLQYIYLK